MGAQSLSLATTESLRTWQGRPYSCHAVQARTKRIAYHRKQKGSDIGTGSVLLVISSRVWLKESEATSDHVQR